MKRFNLIYILIFAITFTQLGCVTGNDDNAVLDDLNSAFSKTPRVTNLLVNGQELTRDTQSVWEFILVSPGDQVTITGDLNTGSGAKSSTYYITRNYFHTSTSFDEASAVDKEPPATDLAPLDVSKGATMELGASAVEYSFTYTVPTVDDDGDDFAEGDHINISFWSVNDIGGVGFVDFSLEFK